MIIQATRYDAAEKKGSFAFTYSGDFTDSRVDDIGDVTLNTSGVFEVLSGKATVSVYILAAGGGGAGFSADSSRIGSGGGGGYQIVEVTLVPGVYSITIGVGGSGVHGYSVLSTVTGGTGGDTTAFGYTCTGGTGGSSGNLYKAGNGGTPNGNNGATGLHSGGSPNGGPSTGTNAAACNGGNGLVRITFS